MEKVLQIIMQISYWLVKEKKKLVLLFLWPGR